MAVPENTLRSIGFFYQNFKVNSAARTGISQRTESFQCFAYHAYGSAQSPVPAFFKVRDRVLKNRSRRSGKLPGLHPETRREDFFQI